MQDLEFLNRTYIPEKKFDELISRLTDKNLITLSFYMSGFDVSEISIAMNVETKTIDSRIERSKKLIKQYYPSFVQFKYECFRNKAIYFFIEQTLDYLLLELC